MDMSYEAVEHRITKALLSIAYRKSWKFKDLADEFGVPIERLQNCYHGRPAKTKLKGGNRQFSDAQEVALCQYLDRLDAIRLLARMSMLVGAANTILQLHHSDKSNPAPPLGNKWAQRFLKCHK